MARVLLLIPHPDDEVVGAAAFISRRREAGDRFFALYLTDGIPAPEQLWRWERAGREDRVRRRRHEARAAAAILRVEKLEFLGFPSRTLKSHLDEAISQTAAILVTQAIDTIWVPAWEGGHQDHDVANFLASRVAEDRSVFEFAEYNRGGGTVRRNRFASPNGSETELRLTLAETELKRRLLAIYQSEQANLSASRTEVESLRPQPRHDYGKPPHEGMLLRERFHWVGRLFRHPRVDFEPSAAIYEALDRFR